MEKDVQQPLSMNTLCPLHREANCLKDCEPGKFVNLSSLSQELGISASPTTTPRKKYCTKTKHMFLQCYVCGRLDRDDDRGYLWEQAWIDALGKECQFCDKHVCSVCIQPGKTGSPMKVNKKLKDSFEWDVFCELTRYEADEYMCRSCAGGMLLLWQKRFPEMFSSAPLWQDE
jgi:hypothetical protein